jgi:signal transduction histidine kinase
VVARRRAEQERERATTASRAKTEFLATMSHELRTPLNAIQGYVQLLDLGLYGELQGEQRDVLARIDRAQRHLLRLIDDVLDHARLSAARVAFAPSAVGLDELLGDVLPMVEPQLAARDLALDVRLPDEGGAPLTAWADRERLVQILLNLLGNAAKFATEGGRVTVAASPAPGDAGALVVGVSDTGPGIPADRREAIFEPFVQVHGGSAYTRTVEGSGLGLAIARDLARGMGGDLWVEDAPEGGAAFRLRLPRAAPPA